MHSSAEPCVEMNGAAEEEMDRLRMRPADVEADIREMARRKRVDAILTSKTFKDELDRLVEAGLIEGNSVGGCLEQISDMMGMVRGGTASFTKGSQCVQPIADLRGAEASQFTKQEKIQRCKLAALCRVVDVFGWNQGVRHHFALRVDAGDASTVLVNPLGLLYGEVTASSLLRVDLRTATVQHAGTAGLGALDAIAFRRLHAAALLQLPQLRCVLHVQLPSVLAVSALRCQLLPLSQQAAALGPVPSLPTGVDDEGRALGELLRDGEERGQSCRVLLLQNRGAICCGETLEEAFFLLIKLQAACEIQMRMMPLGVDNLRVMDAEERQHAYDEARQQLQTPQSSSGSSDDGETPGWRLGEMEFEAMMRKLDGAGFRTAHMYRYPLHNAMAAGGVNGVRAGNLSELDEAYMYSPTRKILAGARAGERNRWLGTAAGGNQSQLHQDAARTAAEKV